MDCVGVNQSWDIKGYVFIPRNERGKICNLFMCFYEGIIPGLSLYLEMLKKCKIENA